MRVYFQKPNIHNQEDRNAVIQIEQILCSIRSNCTDEIEAIYKEIKTEISNNGIGYEIWSVPYQSRFGIESIHYGKSLQDFIKEGAPNLVNIVKPVYAKEVALFRLMNEGCIMPVAGRTGVTYFSADLDLYHRNLLFYVEIDMMPYARYVVVKMLQDV